MLGKAFKFWSGAQLGECFKTWVQVGGKQTLLLSVTP